MAKLGEQCLMFAGPLFQCTLHIAHIHENWTDFGKAKESALPTPHGFPRDHDLWFVVVQCTGDSLQL